MLLEVKGLNNYIKPTLEYVQLNSEERFAGSPVQCIDGACGINGKVIWLTPASPQ